MGFACIGASPGGVLELVQTRNEQHLVSGWKEHASRLHETQLTEGAYWSAVTSVAGRHTTAASGVLNTGGTVVGGFAALTVPIVADRFGWVASLSTGSLMALVAAALWLFIRPDETMQ